MHNCTSLGHISLQGQARWMQSSLQNFFRNEQNAKDERHADNAVGGAGQKVGGWSEWWAAEWNAEAERTYTRRREHCGATPPLRAAHTHTHTHTLSMTPRVAGRKRGGQSLDSVEKCFTTMALGAVVTTSDVKDSGADLDENLHEKMLMQLVHGSFDELRRSSRRGRGRSQVK